MRAAHAAEMRALGPLLRQGFIVKLACGFWIEAEVELVFPTELEARLAQGIVAVLCARMTFGQVGGMGCNLVSDDTIFDVLFVGQAQMLFRRHITKHRAAIPADHRRADAAGYMVVTWSDIGGERSQSV